jgi:hypothetical protein
MPNNSGKYFGNGPLNTEIQKWPCIHKAELWQWQWPNRITCTELPSLSALHIFALSIISRLNLQPNIVNKSRMSEKLNSDHTIKKQSMNFN